MTADIPPPHPVSKALLGCSGIFFIVPLIASVVLLLVDVPFWHDSILDQQAVSATATPYGVEETWKFSRYNPATFKISFRFIDSQGATHEASAATYDNGIIERAQSSQPLQVEYSPQDPNIVRLAGQRASHVGFVVFLPLILAVPSALLFLIFLIAMLRARRRSRQEKTTL